MGDVKKHKLKRLRVIRYFVAPAMNINTDETPVRVFNRRKKREP